MGDADESRSSQMYVVVVYTAQAYTSPWTARHAISGKGKKIINKNSGTRHTFAVRNSRRLLPPLALLALRLMLACVSFSSWRDAVSLSEASTPRRRDGLLFPHNTDLISRITRQTV